MKIKLLVTGLLIAVGASISHAGPATNPAPEYKAAKLDAACADEGTLSGMTAAKPLICTDRKWHQVVFKTDPDGTVQSLTYSGKCSVRFADGQTEAAYVVLKRTQLADLCMPSGWKIKQVAISGTDYLTVSVPQNIEGVALLRSQNIEGVALLRSNDASQITTVWVYASKPETQAVQKFMTYVKTIK